MIQLSSDMTINTLSIPEGKDIVLDLNGKVLNYANTTGEPMIDMGAGSSLTVYNGTVRGDGTAGAVAFNTTGAEMSFTNVAASGFERFVNVEDHKGVGVDSRIRIVGSNITASESVVYMLGNGEMSGNLSELVIEKSVLHGDYMGIIGNGNNPNYGTDITVIDSTITGYWTSIYHPQKDSYLTVVNSKLEGWTGIVLKGGYTTITGSQIKGTGAHSVPNYSGSGFADTGDGVYLEANYAWITDVQLYDCEVSSSFGDAVRKYKIEEPHATLVVHSGTYDSDVSSYVPATSSYAVATNEHNMSSWVVTVTPVAAEEESESTT